MLKRPVRQYWGLSREGESAPFLVYRSGLQSDRRVCPWSSMQFNRRVSGETPGRNHQLNRD